MKVTVRYPAGHSYIKDFALDEELHCPFCGAGKSVWVEQGGGDYYVGEEHICVHCAQSFNLLTDYGGFTREDDSPSGQILTQLRQGLDTE